MAPKGWDKIEPSRRKRPPRTGKPSSPPGKPRLRIKEASKQSIIAMLKAWKGKLTWPLLMARVNKKFKGDWKYQSLAKHPELQALFTATQARIRKGAPAAGGVVKEMRGTDLTDSVLQDRIDHLQRENEVLKRRLTDYEARMLRWRKNAALARVAIATLDHELQENDRGRSDRKK